MEATPVFKPDIVQNVQVHHPVFGLGKVTQRYGTDEKSKVIVKFREEGEKKLALKYARLEVDKPEETEDEMEAGSGEEE